MFIKNPAILPHSSGFYDKLNSNHERLLFLVRCGIQAPSANNVQPWFFKLGEDSITILPNFKRYLPAGDPTKRELNISMGTVRANIEVAATALGLPFSNAMLPLDNGIEPVVITFSSLEPQPEEQADAILDLIFNRHNNRSEYTAQPIPTTTLEKLRAMVKTPCELHILTDKKNKVRIEELLGEAAAAAFENKQFTRELSQWVRPSFPWYRDGMPGFSMHIPWLFSLLLPFAVRFLDMRNVQRKIHRKYIASASAIAVVTIPEASPSFFHQTGQTFEQLALFLEQEGIKVGVMQAAIEIPSAQKKLKELLQITTEPALFMRLGYSNIRPKASPRLPLEHFLIYE